MVMRVDTAAHILLPLLVESGEAGLISDRDRRRPVGVLGRTERRCPHRLDGGAARARFVVHVPSHKSLHSRMQRKPIVAGCGDNASQPWRKRVLKFQKFA
jgi:hypothetical protein